MRSSRHRTLATHVGRVQGLMEAAALCDSLGSTLGDEIRLLAGSAPRPAELPANVTPIEDAPSLRRDRRSA